jgi:transcriptional regulator with XRE-family HTH domain
MGDRLRIARNARDLSVRDVCAALDVSPNTVTQWEHGARPKDPDLRDRVADLYGVPEDVLFREYHSRLAELAASIANGSA